LRRTIRLLIAGALGAGVFASGATAVGAQTPGAGDLAGFCAARLEANAAQSKAENQAALDKIATAAPAPVAQATAELSAMFKKKGDKAFDTQAGAALINQIDTYGYESCPGTKVPVSAIDYGYVGISPDMKAGPTNFKLTNYAPKEEHELVIGRLTPAGESVTDLEKLLSKPEKKLGKYIDFETLVYAGAAPGEVGYAPTSLQPGKYFFACFVPQGGEENGEPHFMLGMDGVFTVS
jgi:hypothetical protein